MHNVRLICCPCQMIYHTLNMSEFTVLNVSNIKKSLSFHVYKSIFYKKSYYSNMYLFDFYSRLRKDVLERFEQHFSQNSQMPSSEQMREWSGELNIEYSEITKWFIRRMKNKLLCKVRDSKPQNLTKMDQNQPKLKEENISAPDMSYIMGIKEEESIGIDPPEEVFIVEDAD